MQASPGATHAVAFEVAAKADDLASFYRLRSVPGIGEILSLTIFYEVPDFDRFDTIQQFASYARLAVPPAVLGVAPRGESAGKPGPSRGRKQGNVFLKWAFSEAAVLLLRGNPAPRNFTALLQGGLISEARRRARRLRRVDVDPSSTRIVRVKRLGTTSPANDP